MKAETTLTLDIKRRTIWKWYVETMDEALSVTNTKEHEIELYSVAADLFISFKEAEADYLLSKNNP